MWMLDYFYGLASQQAEDRYPNWMGFTEIRADLQKKKAAGLHWLLDSSCMSEYRDTADRQWGLLSKRYDEVSWGGLVYPELQGASTQAHSFGISGGRVQNVSQTVMDTNFDGEPYTKELYENACHVRGAGATWLLNTGPGIFRVRLHLCDWWHGGDRRFILVLSSGDSSMERVICTPANGIARIDEFTINVEPPSTTMDLQILRDDALPGDSFPCFSGFDVQRLQRKQENWASKQEQTMESPGHHRSAQPPKARPSTHAREKPAGGHREQPAGGHRNTTACIEPKNKPRVQSPSQKVSARRPKSQPAGPARAQATGGHQKTTDGKKPFAWNLARMVLHAPPNGLLNHPDDPNDSQMFKCISRCSPDGHQEVIGLFAAPPDRAIASCCGLVLTCPGAGGGPGPADPFGGGGGGTYGGYNVYGKLASELPKQGIAVLLLHYPPGEPGHPLQDGIPRTVHHVEALMQWVRENDLAHLPVALVGWSMGGAVAIEAAAKLVRNPAICIRGVATIASMKEVSMRSPSILVDAEVDLLLMHNLSEKCNASNSHKLACLAGGRVEPLLFPDEDHGVRSAFNKLSAWLPTLFSPKRQ